ncbi:hypothetical protein NHQ30_003784 [Ciborinia camelliae]|nr:hypothetical protein NHQ30_003784 [Ciborinia camelliae]
MSNTELPKGSIKKVDFLNASLPANAPSGHPHVIEFNIEGESKPPADLTAVDAIATVLRHENPQCLQKLLDMNVDIIAFQTMEDDNHYTAHIIRKLREVHVFVRNEITQIKRWSVRYEITDSGEWVFDLYEWDFAPSVDFVMNFEDSAGGKARDQALAMFILSDYQKRQAKIEEYEEELEILKTSDPTFSEEDMCGFSPASRKWNLDGDVTLDLPANAPRGYPHILQADMSNQAVVPEDLSLVDVLATIIFEWNPSALYHLLNIENEEFYCAFECQIMGTDSDSEVSYRICNDRRREIKSAQDRHPGSDIPSMVKRFLEYLLFSIWMYEPEVEGTKEKSSGRISIGLNDAGPGSRAGNRREKGFETPMNEDTNAKLTKIEAQTGSLRKRRRDD